MKTSVSNKTAPLQLMSAGDLFLSNPERTIEWLGGVNYDNLEDIFSQIKKLLKQAPTEEIHLMVNSWGGQTGIGMSFYDAMKTWLCPNLITIGSGDVDSSGVIIFLAGKKRYLTKNTTLLLHLAGRTFDAGKRYTTVDMENMVKEDKLKDYQYACVLSDATGGRFCPDKILELMAKNTVLTADEAVSMGLAHKAFS